MLFSLNGFGGDRTHDQEIKSFLRYQLRYEPEVGDPVQAGSPPAYLGSYG